ncbi:hypothetical protein O9993_10025 [Vibrio lentus]|nr:hypothetical protein [Vibrio lentus]
MGLFDSGLALPLERFATVAVLNLKLAQILKAVFVYLIMIKRFDAYKGISKRLFKSVYFVN